MYINPYNADGSLKFIPVNGVSCFRKIYFDSPKQPEPDPDRQPKQPEPDPDPEQIKISLVDFSAS